MKKTIFKILLISIFSTVSCQSKENQKSNNISKNLAMDNPVKRIEDYLSKLGEGGFSGSVLFAKGNTILLNRGYGFSDKDKNIKNTSQTVFDIGSVTKQFTAAGILKLEMQGKLKVEDKIGNYLENVPEDKKEITIHHLLTHSSGLLSGIGDDYEAITTQDFNERAFAQKLLFKPGSAYEYSNVGYSLLGMIIEKVSDETYESYLYNNLWKPSKMEQTGYRRPSFLDKNIAIGYNRKHEALGKPNDQPWDKDAPYWHLKANGGILSTADDMYKWHLALKTDEILSKEAKEKYFTPYVKEGEDARSYYSYGWAMYKTSRGTTLAAHNGGNGIFFADFWRYLDDDMVIIVLNNNSTPYSQIIASQIGALCILPDFEPTYPDENEMQGGDFDDSEVDNLVKLAVKVLNESDESEWSSFIENNGTKDFINMAPMQLHLKYFKKFHNKLKGGKIMSVNIDLDEIITNIQTKNGIETLVIGIEKDKEGLLKFGGMMIE